MPDHGFWERGGLGQKEPVVVSARGMMGDVCQQVFCRNDIHDGQAGDPVGRVQRHTMGGAPAAVVTRQMKLVKTERIHQVQHILAHRTKPHFRHRLGLKTVAIPAQVGCDDGKMPF